MTSSRNEIADPSPVSAHVGIRVRVPALPATHIARPRLTDQLHAADPEGVVVVHGPAGSGKTSLVAGCVSGLTRPVSWYTLDERDQVPSDFWTNLSSAIERLRSEGPATLVLDDVHMVADHPDLIAVIRDLIRYPPPGMQLVVISRSVNSLALDRARLDGRLTTIDFDDLRFSTSEAGELLQRLSPGADEAWLDDTMARVDGWAAGLQLFAIARRSTSGSEAGNDGHRPARRPATPGVQMATDYLFAEAFRSEPDDVVEFLREIAVVGGVSVPLARAISGRDDADRLLQVAFERDLFVSRRGRGWYELHPLVREALVTKLEDEDPEHARDLHARAARWLEADRDHVAAIEHWTRAGCHREAILLLSEVHLALYDSGQHDVVRQALAAMPVDAYATDFAATMAFTWCHVLVDRSRFLDGVERLAGWAQRSPVHGVLASRLTLLQSVATTIRGDWVTGGLLARDAMAELGPDWLLDSYGRFGFNMMARNLALSERWSDDHDDIRRADLELAHDPVRRVSFEGIRALGEALAGQPLDAVQTAGGVRVVADVTSLTILGDELRLADVVARRELGDDDGIVDDLRALADSDVPPTTYVTVRALAELVATHLDHDSIDAALESLASLQDLVEHAVTGAGANSLLARCAVDVALATETLDDVDRWIDQIDDPFWQPVSRARVMLRRDDHTGASGVLGDAITRCARHDVVLALLQAVATRDHEEALKFASMGVESAVAHGMVRTVATQGHEAMELVERCAWRAPVGWLDRVRRASVSGQGTAGELHPRADQSALVEPLTERERDVLRFLPSRLTLQEIAKELYISMNTLKFHLKVIYRKLGVSSRAEAAVIARQMTLIRTP